MFRKLILSLSAFSLILSSGCTKDDANDPRALDATSLPVLTTNTVTAITQTSATTGGNVTYDGGIDILVRGICWSTLQNPTLSDNHTSDGTGTGSFTSVINGLTSGTTYYVRAYATNKNGTSYGDQKTFSTTAVLSIGLNYAGGIIFYLDTSGIHGLICADVNQSDSSEWGCNGVSITGADGTAIGSGAQNTMDIVNGCTSSSAAKICDTLTLHGYSDWFLPSKEELRLMYTNLHTAGLGGFLNAPYWSSSEMTSSFAWQVIFTNGITQGTSKNNFISVRAVRAF
jgi:hypothetical protein